eukprot:9065564-Pyramimonas_sp.AAC.1
MHDDCTPRRGIIPPRLASSSSANDPFAPYLDPRGASRGVVDPRPRRGAVHSPSAPQRRRAVH